MWSSCCSYLVGVQCLVICLPHIHFLQSINSGPFLGWAFLAEDFLTCVLQHFIDAIVSMMESLFSSWSCKGLNLLDMLIWNAVLPSFIWRHSWDTHVVPCLMFGMLSNVLRRMFVPLITHTHIFPYSSKFLVDANIVNLTHCDMVKGSRGDIVDPFLRKDVSFYYNWLRKHGSANISLFLFM